MFRPDSVPPASAAGGVHLVFQRGELISDMRSRDGCLIAQQQLDFSNWPLQRQHFLGYWHDQACYAVEIDETVRLDPMQYQKGSLYQVLGRVDAELFALAGRASQILAWERDHQFCGRCGVTMRLDPKERAMHCEPCGTMMYPRIAPCIIVLVTRGEELLLASSPNFRMPMYSTLAGFIEAGESAEETLVREVREEVGLEVRNLQYFRSQAWPFPNQLMLGYFAEYDGGDIVCQPTEISDAQWFNYQNLPAVPPTTSISGQLIQHYVSSLT